MFKNIEKTLKCLKKFTEKLLKFKVHDYRCIATEACRQVINPEFFIRSNDFSNINQHFDSKKFNYVTGNDVINDFNLFSYAKHFIVKYTDSGKVFQVWGGAG